MLSVMLCITSLLFCSEAERQEVVSVQFSSHNYLMHLTGISVGNECFERNVAHVEACLHHHLSLHIQAFVSRASKRLSHFSFAIYSGPCFLF